MLSKAASKNIQSRPFSTELLLRFNTFNQESSGFRCFTKRLIQRCTLRGFTFQFDTTEAL